MRARAHTFVALAALLLLSSCEGGTTVADPAAEVDPVEPEAPQGDDVEQETTVDNAAELCRRVVDDADRMVRRLEALIDAAENAPAEDAGLAEGNMLLGSLEEVRQAAIDAGDAADECHEAAGPLAEAATVTDAAGDVSRASERIRLDFDVVAPYGDEGSREIFEAIEGSEEDFERLTRAAERINRALPAR